jgi:hypothetical protein
MFVINRLDLLIIAMAFVFMLNMIAILYGESEGVFITVCGAIVTLVGYAFIRPQVVEECNLNGGK